MYKYFRLVTLILNIEGGSAEYIEKMTKEVKDESGEVKVVACTKEESLIKLYNKLSSYGGNPSIQSIKCILFDDNGNYIKMEELIKPVAITE